MLRLLLACVLLLPAAAAQAHLLAPRVDLDELAAGARLVVRGEIVQGSTLLPGGAATAATLAVDRVLLGESPGPAVTFVAEDDHGGGWKAGDRPVLFLSPREAASPEEPRWRTTAARADSPLAPEAGAAAALDAYFSGVAGLAPGDRAGLESLLVTAVITGPLPLSRHGGRRLSRLAREAPLSARSLAALLQAPLAPRAPEAEVCGGIAALAAQGGAAPASLAALLQARDPDCRRALAAGLSAAATAEPVAAALALAVADPEEAVRLAAAGSLGGAGDERGLDVLLQASRDRRVPLRLSVVEPLAVLHCSGASAAGRALEALAGDQDRGVALAAAGAAAVPCERRPGVRPGLLRGLSGPGLLAGAAVVGLLLGARQLARRRSAAARR